MDDVMRTANLLHAAATTCRFQALVLSLATIILCQLDNVESVPVGYPQQTNNLHAISTKPTELPTQHHQLFNLDQLSPLQRQQLQQLHQQQLSPQLQKQLLIQSQQQQQLQQQQAAMYHAVPKAVPNQYTTATYELLLDLRHQMMTSQFKFDDHFKDLLSKSKMSLHNLFLDTYGILYEKNAAIFTTLFDSLEQYYLNGKVRLTKSMENFFLALYQKIFQAYNLGYEFDSKYLDCTSAQLNQLRPFGDMPDKMIIGIRHGFLAARTFNQALSDGIDVIKDIITLGPLTQCNQMINDKLLKNSLIGGSNQQAPSKVPCPQFCEQVVRRCIGNGTLENLNDKWKGYVLSLVDLAKKMTTTYNIETIIAPLSLHLSEAIMTFQENGKNISDHLFNTCGKPVISEPLHSSTLKPTGISGAQPVRRLVERAANLGPAPAIVSRHNQHISGVNQQLGPPQGSHWKVSHKDILSAGAPLDDLTQIGQTSPVIIDEIRNYMLSIKYFWHNLPKAVCTHNQTLSANVSKIKLTSDCFQDKFTIHDVNSDIRYRNEMQRHINRLEGMKSRIDSAINGVEIDWSMGQPGSINPGMNNNPIIKPSSLSTTTTTTTTVAPGLIEDDEECEEGDSECGEITEFSGDGKNDESATNDDLSIDPDTVTEDPEDTDDPRDTSTSDDTTNEDFSEETPTTGYPDPDSEIDRPTTPQDKVITNYDITNNWIDSPNQPGAQTKSSQTSSKLVIDDRSHLLFASLIISALSFVTHFQLLTHRSIIRQSS